MAAAVAGNDLWPGEALFAMATALALAGLWAVAARLVGSARGAQAPLIAARPLPRWVPPSLATMVWTAATRGTDTLADGLQRPHTGDGQFYVLLVPAYFLAIYFARAMIG